MQLNDKHNYISQKGFYYVIHKHKKHSLMHYNNHTQYKTHSDEL